MRRAVRGAGDPPFSRKHQEDLAAWADGRIDISEIGGLEDGVLSFPSDEVDGQAARTIIGSRFGWAAVSPVPMDWVEFMSARQLMSEERLGTAHRAVAQADQETVDATKAAMRKAGLQPVVLMPRVPAEDAA